MIYLFGIVLVIALVAQLSMLVYLFMEEVDPPKKDRFELAREQYWKNH
mgnify:CR=1 FL=1|tara:strand:- start:168 stop:311 length:144 start_codon:yes stop_codon:yes gene_type:complete